VPANAYLIDANLLLLLVVGTASVELITKHKRNRTYSADDFRSLKKLLGDSPQLMVTPHVLTETSNLLCQIDEPARTLLLATLRLLIGELDERFVAAREASERREFLALGLTDAALLIVMGESAQLLTADLDLWAAALKAHLPAINFAHYRQANL